MIEKRTSPRGRSVRVTFSIPGDSVEDQALVVGDFNDWDEEKTPMKFDSKRNVWSASVTLKPNNSYRFRYKVDGEWRNDSTADAYESNPYLSEDCVVHV